MKNFSCWMAAFLLIGPTHAHAAPGEEAHSEIPEPMSPPWMVASAPADLPAPLRAWQSSQGSDWTVLIDPRTDTAHRIIGPGLPIEHEVHDTIGATRAALGVLETHPSLLGPGVRSEHLRPSLAEYHRDTWYVAFDREINGVPIDGAQVEVRIRDGKVVLIGVDTFPSLDADTTPTLNADEALDVLHDALPVEADLDAIVSGPDLTIVPMDSNGTIQGVLAWRIEVRTTGVADWAEWYVDAKTGEVAAYRQLLRHTLGSVTARVDDVYPGNGWRDDPMPFIKIDGQMTAIDGTLDVTDTASGTLSLDGRLAYVSNEAGWEYSTSYNLTQNNPDINVDANSDSQAELDVYAYVGNAKNRANTIYYSNDWVWERFPIFVNINKTCNAYYDGWSINFFRKGGSCNNTGRVEGIVYHEFGHGFHHDAIVTGSYSKSMGEGAADYMSATLTNDHRMARGFFTNGEHLRDVGRDRVYPYDWTYRIHTDGLIYAGAMWDLRNALINKRSYYPGVETADHLYYAGLQGSDNMTDAYVEAILAADEDGDISNGVRDGCLIYEAFNAHGLAIGPKVYSSMDVSHKPIVQWSVGDGDQSIQVTVRRDGCGGPAVQSVQVQMDGPDGPKNIDLSNSGGIWIGNLPEPSSPGLVTYSLIALDGASEVRMPQTGETFSVMYTDLEELLCEDFENGISDWTHGAVSSDERFRAPDEWDWGRPQGQAKGPSNALSGNNIVGLDIGTQGDGDGFYEAELHTWLRSPVYDIANREDVRLQFWRWVSVEDEEFDAATVTINDEEVWRNPRGDGDQNFQDVGWVLMDFPIEDSDTVQIEFGLTSDERFEMGGWAIDRVCILAKPLVTDWLPGDPNSNDDDDPGQRGKLRIGGCACDTITSLASTWWLIGLLPLAWARRRP